MISFADFFHKKIPLTLDARPNLSEKFIRFSFGQRLVHLASSSILIDTGARFCFLDRQTIANIAGVAFFTSYRTRPILGMPFLENVKLILDRKKKRSLVLY